MSGFVGILNLDGAPVDGALLERMTRSLAFRGPDAQEIWCQGPVGLGHALLQISTGVPQEKHPAQLDGRFWIAADARIDDRKNLIGKLKSKSQAAESLSLSTPDAELILHAYDTWGEACVEHLLGDFSFAIWDARERRLFCARDHFGVKPFFYAHVGSCLIFSNTLDCIRQHPSVSNRLNDLAIADFLLFDTSKEPSATSFVDIRRLRPAHTMTCERREISIRRYWELSVTTPIQYARDAEFVERFRELLDTAVADRLRGESAGVLMSGGLDSPTVAASARRIFNKNGDASRVHAYTQVFDRLIHHEERHYAKLVAEALKIPIEFFPNDDLKIFERADQTEYFLPEPTHTAWPDNTPDQLRRLSSSSRVALTGYGADPALCGRISVHFRQLIEKKQLGRALADAARFLGVEGRLSRLYLRKRWGILFAPKSQSPVYPGWLNEDLEKRHGLRSRWEYSNRSIMAKAAARSEGREAMVDLIWPNLFESYDAGSTHVPVEVCHPIFDLRLVNFLLAIPRLPWCSDKELLREAARGRLPEAVRLRCKSPLSAEPLNVLLNRPETAWVDRFEPVPELEQYVVRNRIPAVYKEEGSWAAWMHLRPLSLNFWLRGQSR
jgi:asparagine synthase (glutamine-hydrolysing)